MILVEYRRVVHELGAKYPSVEVRGLLDFVTINSLICAADPLADPICDDPDYDKFLACALTGRADVIVTGDKALLRAKAPHGVRILRPREFADEHLTG